MNLKILAAVLTCCALTQAAATATTLVPGDHRVDAAGSTEGRLASNSVVDIIPGQERVWFGTGRGLTVLDPADSSWTSISQDEGLGRGGVSALAVNDTIVWAATAYNEKTFSGYLPAGGGVGFSTDGGDNWLWMPQPLDSAEGNPEDFKPTTTNIQNVTYDIALSRTAVWIASFGGGLRRLTFADLADSNRVWDVVPPDDEPFSALGNLNHRVFSLTYYDNVLWVGTAAGINRSGNEGATWTNFSHQNSVPGVITGNFVTALAHQEVGDRHMIWAATWEAEGATEYYGVCMTDNGGSVWNEMLSDSAYREGGRWQVAPFGTPPDPDRTYLVDEFGPLKVHNFGFRGDEVWAAADDGLWWSRDLGRTWVNLPAATPINDPTLRESLIEVDYFSAAGAGDSIWVGSDDGVAVGWWDGSAFSWRLHRAHRSAGVGGEAATYAYPNPFSPNRGGITRIQVPVPGERRVSFSIWNFAMEKVFESAELTLPGGGAGDMTGYGAIVWDGRDGSGRVAANGVYFYRVKVDDAAYWGKIMVLD